MQKHFANAFIVVMTLALVAAALEIGARLLKDPVDVYKITNVSADTHYPRPYVMFAGKPLVDDHNLLGYRGPLPAAERAPGEYRVAVIGGSTVWGTSRSQFVKFLGERLAKDNVRVFNFGVGGSVSRQDFVRLVVDITPYQPDLVLFYGGGNDLAPSIDDRVNYPHRFALYQFNPGMSIQPTWDDFVQMLVLNSQFLRRVLRKQINEHYRTSIHGELEPWRAPPTTEMRIDAYFNNVRRMQSYCAAIGCRLVNVLQPLAFLKHPLAPAEKGEYFGGAIAGYQELPRLARERGVDLVDLSRAFEGVNDAVFSDYIHTFPNGDEIIADKLAALLLPLIRADRAAPRPKPLALEPETYFIDGKK